MFGMMNDMIGNMVRTLYKPGLWEGGTEGAPSDVSHLIVLFGMGCTQVAKAAEAVSLASRPGFSDRELVPELYPLECREER